MREHRICLQAEINIVNIRINESSNKGRNDLNRVVRKTAETMPKATTEAAAAPPLLLKSM